MIFTKKHFIFVLSCIQKCLVHKHLLFTPHSSDNEMTSVYTYVAYLLRY